MKKSLKKLEVEHKKAYFYRLNLKYDASIHSGHKPNSKKVYWAVQVKVQQVAIISKIQTRQIFHCLPFLLILNQRSGFSNKKSPNETNPDLNNNMT